MSIENSYLKESRLTVKGKNNKIYANDVRIYNSIIDVTGENNNILIEESADLKHVNIIIRGNNCSLRIGKKTSFGGARIVIVGIGNYVTIGMECLFSDHIEIWASDTHGIYNNEGTWINKEKPITIGNNVWIGSRVTVLKGVTIGNHSIIGINSVVTKDISSSSIAVGNPARIIKNNVKWTLEYPQM